MLGNPSVHALDLLSQHLHEVDNALQNVRVSHVFALAFADHQSNQLAPPKNKGVQLQLSFVVHGLYKALPVWSPMQHFRQLGQHQSVHAVRLRQPTHGLCEVTRLSGIDDDNSKACRLESTRTGHLILSCCLHHDQ